MPRNVFLLLIYICQLSAWNRRGSQGVVSWTCDPVLTLGQRFDSHSRRSFCCNQPGKRINYILPSIFGWDLKQEVRVCAQITLHTCKIPSHFSKKSRPLWSVMMDDGAPTHDRRIFIKVYKNVLPRKLTVIAEICGETYSKKDKSSDRLEGWGN